MLVLALDHAVTHPVANLTTVGAFDLDTIIIFNTLLLAALSDMTQLWICTLARKSFSTVRNLVSYLHS